MHLIISDTHIGDQHSNKNLPKLFSLLEKFSETNCDLILNGDIFDFAKTMSFDERHRIFLSMIQKFKSVTYIEGNHDWFVSGLKNVLPGITFKKEVILRIDNKIIRIAHGHQTDYIAMHWPIFNRFIIKVNAWIYDNFDFDFQHAARKTWLVQKLLLQRQENKLIRLEKVANVLIAGHTHRPCFRNVNGTDYYNTGDWVEPGHSAYVIIDDGNIELVKL